METKRKGNLAEAKVLAQFVELGYSVLLPFGDTEPYDLVIDRGKGFESVQVKHGRYNKNQDGILFNAYSLSGRTHNQVATTYIGKADLFGVYFAPLDTVYLIPVAECPTTKVTLRLTPPSNGQQSGIRYATDHLAL